MSSYKFATIDPRPFALKGELQKLAAMGRTLGAEVTVQAVADALTEGNIDPQHTVGDAGTAAIEAAVTWPLPSTGTTIVTLRPDADSVGVMAVMVLREASFDADRGTTPLGQATLARVAEIAEADKGHSEWSPADGWRPATVLDAIKAEVMNFRRPIEERVDLMVDYLFAGEFSGWKEVAARIEQERRETVGLLDEVSTSPSGRVAVVTSTSRFAVSAAYAKADVVVAANPEFRFGGGEPHRKVTVCQLQPGLVDLKSVFTTLNEVEPGWGGSPTIGGSPQGESSVITTDEVVRVVEEHLLG